MFIGADWLAAQFALDSAIYVYIIAGILAVFALQIANIVRTRNIRSWEITSIIIGDIAWVVASVVLLAVFHRTITPTGVVLATLVGVAVLFFALTQIRGLKQSQCNKAA